jgi:hypothetical protein
MFSLKFPQELILFAFTSPALVKMASAPGNAFHNPQCAVGARGFTVVTEGTHHNVNKFTFRARDLKR